jgi:hypothetical protein
MATSTSKGVRVAAGIVCAVFAAFVLIHLLWAVGITWGLNSELAGVGDTEAGIALTAVSLVAAAAGTAAIIVHARTPAKRHDLRSGAHPSLTEALEPEGIWGRGRSRDGRRGGV